MDALFYIGAVVLGIWSAFFVVGYAMLRIECPFDRCAYYLTFLATLFIAVLAAWFLLGGLTFSVLSTFSLTFVFLWSIMDPKRMLHLQFKT